jgi:peptidoglycan/LPS O-acetylase OafA/YrhL
MAASSKTLIPDFGYRPEIDGLRALAVLAVVTYHAGLGVPGGFAGVDVFFVISGYLITSIILRDLQEGSFTIVHFWQRRIRRIVPALALMVAVVLVAGWFLMLPADYLRLGQSAVWQVLFAANIFFWRQTGYFAPNAEEQPLLHTWSLAVEEQFYLVVPVALGYLLTFQRFRGRLFLLSVFAAITVVSLSWSAYGVVRYPSAAFYLLPTRAWELALGSLVSLLPRCERGRWKICGDVAAAAGLASILFSFFAFSSDTPFPGLAALVPCLGTAAFIWGTAVGAASLRAAMSLVFVVFVGKISYSLYLWHWPFFAFATYLAWDPLSLPTRLLLVAGSFIVAVASYRYVEQPFRSRYFLPKSSQMPGLLLASSLVLAVTGGFIWATGGAPFRLSPQILSYTTDAVAPDFVRNPSPQDVRSRNLTRLGKVSPEAEQIDFVVWGDSHAMSLAKAFDAYLDVKGLSGILAARLSNAPVLDAYWRGNGQSPAENEKCPDFNAAVFDLVQETGAKHVVMVCNWEMYTDDKGTQPLRKMLPATVKRLREVGVEVTIMQQIPNHHFDVAKYVGLAAITGRDITPRLAKTVNYEPLGSLDKKAWSLLAAEGVHFLDPSPYLIGENPNHYAAEKNGRILYYDGGHLTPEAAKTVLLPLLLSHLPASQDK